MNSVFSILSTVPDPRHGNRLTYSIDYLLLIAFSALMSGFKTWNQFALYAELHEKDLRKVYKRLSREARKYGLFLCIATQMPRDIPLGTLSQMGTFVVHRLINEQDKKAVENAASAANRNSLSFLPILGEGEALLVGVDFPMPLTIKIDAPKRVPDSQTPKLKKKKTEAVSSL